MRVLLVVLISRFYSIRLIYTRWKRNVLMLQESLFLRFFSSSCAYIESLLSLFITGIPFDSWKYSTWNIIIRDTKNLMFTIFENSLLSSEIKKIDKLISSLLKLKVKKDTMDNSWVHQRVDDSSWRVKCHLAGRKRSSWKGETRSPLCRSGETVKVIPLRGLLFAGEGGAKRIFDQSRSRVGTCVLVVVGTDLSSREKINKCSCDCCRIRMNVY